MDALGVTLHENGKNKAVLFYDTEQSEVQLYKNISNLLRRADVSDAGMVQGILPYGDEPERTPALHYPELGQIPLSIWRCPSGGDRRDCGFDKMRQR